MAESVFDRDRRIRDAQLSMTHTFYLCTLNQFIGKNADAWPSQAKIAERMNASVRSVKYWQSQLEQMGVIVISSGKGCKVQNRYSLRLDALQIKPTLNSATIAPFDTETESEWCNPCPDNGATLAPGIGQQLPTERTVKEHKKEQAFSFPEKLRTPEFSEAWQSWVRFRRELKKKLTPSTITMQLAMLDKFGSTKAVRSIDASITNGWQGLFDPDGKNDKGSPAAETAWQRIRKAAKETHGDAKAFEATIGQKLADILKTIGLTRKKIDEANGYEQGKFPKQFIDEFQRQGAAA